MDKEKILETFYEVVNESVDWYAEDKNNNTYSDECHNSYGFFRYFLFLLTFIKIGRHFLISPLLAEVYISLICSLAV